MSNVEHRRSLRPNLVPDRTLEKGDAQDIRTCSGLHLHVRSAALNNTPYLTELFNHLGENELGFRFLNGTDRFKPHKIIEARFA